LVFAPAIAYTLGPNPTILTTGDFNEDGHTDIAVDVSYRLVGGPGASVAILLGHGDGSFDPPVHYPAGIAPRGLTVGDFNEDGISDLAVVNQDGNDVSIFMGLGAAGAGDGTFAPRVDYPSGAGPFLVRTGDFDEDGITDLAIANNAQYSVSILRGLGIGGVGNGTFAAPVSYALNTYSGGLAVGDFDSDGILDLVATQNYAGTVAVLLGNGSGGVGNGTFASAVHYPAGVEPFDITLGDLDDDGISDLVVANTGGGGVTFLRGNGSAGIGNGTFAAPQFLPSGNSTQATLGDVNQDGIDDLLVSVAASPGWIRVYRGLGNGLVSPAEFTDPVDYPVGRVPIQAVLASFSEDGKVDCVTPNFEGDDISLLLGVCAADSRAPTLTRVRDVPNDQGGKVFVTWTRSSLDVTGGAVTSYRVWRRIPPGLAAGIAAEVAAWGEGSWATAARVARPADGASGVAIEYWEALATLPAQRLEGYGYTAATTQDSMPHANPYTAFFITALTGSIDVFYSSKVDSGYSVDNLPPHVPAGFVAEPASPGAVVLRWAANADPDLHTYRLYRGTRSDFIPSAENLLVSQPDTSFLDPAGAGFAYRLTAVDTHGNEGPPSVVLAAIPTAVGDEGPSFALHAVRPNPSLDGGLAVSFTLAGGGPARLEVVDAAGRVVAVRRIAVAGAGTVTVARPGDLSAGVYLVRLRQGARELRTKAVVLR
jgi:hypothetical protein